MAECLAPIAKNGARKMQLRAFTVVDNTKFNKTWSLGVVDHYIDKKKVDNTKIHKKRVTNNNFE